MRYPRSVHLLSLGLALSGVCAIGVSGSEWEEEYSELDTDPEIGFAGIDLGPEVGFMAYHTESERPLFSGAAGDNPDLPAGRPIQPPSAWREMYAEVERCAGLTGNFDAVTWAVVDTPIQGSTGQVHGYTQGNRIVLVGDDTTYVRHEMLHHILTIAGWRPHTLRPGERYTIADLHPMPLFGLCTAGH